MVCGSSQLRAEQRFIVNSLAATQQEQEVGGHRSEGYKAALSVSVFHTIGRICCMEDTMGLGKFFTSAVTAWRRKKGANVCVCEKMYFKNSC